MAEMPIRAEIPISQEDIDNLGDKLDSIEGDEEKALLSGILALAAKAVRGDPAEEPAPLQVIHETDPASPVTVETEGDLPSFRDQIAKAFTPGVISPEQGDTVVSRVLVGHVLSITVDQGLQD